MHLKKNAPSRQLAVGVGFSFPKVALNAGNDATQCRVRVVLYAGHVVAMADVFVLTFDGRRCHCAHIVFYAVTDVSS